MSKTGHQHTMGEGGECICTKCEARTPHRQGVPCRDEVCPACGGKMLRVDSEHYRLWRQKKGG